MFKDRLDAATWSAIVIAMLAMGAVLSGGRAADNAAVKAAVVEPDLVFDRQAADLARQLGRQKPIAADRDKLMAIADREPANSVAQLWLGDLYRADRRLGEAAEHYRKAVRLERGLADARSPISRWRDLTSFVEEGLTVYLREKNLRPGDEGVNRVIKDLYFIRRSLAGGCD